MEDDFLPKNGIRDGVKDQGRSIKERLGIKYTDKDAVRAEESGESVWGSSSSDSDEDWCKRSKIPRMRMHADDEEEKVQKRRAKLRYQVSYLFYWKRLIVSFDFFYTNSVLSLFFLRWFSIT